MKLPTLKMMGASPVNAGSIAYTLRTDKSYISRLRFLANNFLENYYCSPAAYAFFADPDIRQRYLMSDEMASGLGMSPYFDGQYWQFDKPYLDGIGERTTNYVYAINRKYDLNELKTLESPAANGEKILNDYFAYLISPNADIIYEDMHTQYDRFWDDGIHVAKIDDSILVIYKHYGSGVFNWTISHNGLRHKGSDAASLAMFKDNKDFDVNAMDKENVL